MLNKKVYKNFFLKIIIILNLIPINGMNKFRDKLKNLLNDEIKQIKKIEEITNLITLTINKIKTKSDILNNNKKYNIFVDNLNKPISEYEKNIEKYSKNIIEYKNHIIRIQYNKNKINSNNNFI